jgi:hypothetical protein
MGVFATSQFVKPKVARLDIGDGHWVEIKHELTYGDMQDYVRVTRNDLTASGLNLVAAYLLDWSLVDDEGQPVPVDTDAAKVAALRALTQDAFGVIDAAIGQHVEAMKAAKKPLAPSGRKRSGRALSSVA